MMITKELLLDEITCFLKQRSDLVSIAVRQRAKFEGWLKFELANALKRIFDDTSVEYPIRGRHVDLYSNHSLIELKTPNTNYHARGCEDITRPITKNVNDILNDIRKLRGVPRDDQVRHAFIAFVMFPVPSIEKRKPHLEKIDASVGEPNTRIVYKMCEVDELTVLVYVAKIY